MNKVILSRSSVFFRTRGVVDGGSIGGNGVVGGVVVEGGDFCFVCVLAFVGTRAPAAQVVFVVIGSVGGGCGGVVHFNFSGIGF